MDKKAVIFDLDGVIVDTEPMYIAVNQDLYRRLGIGVSREEQLTFIGLSSPEVWKKLRRKFSLSRSVEELINLETETVFHALKDRNELSPIAGIVPLLNILKGRGIPLAVASSSPGKIVTFILSRLKLKSFFRVTVTAEDVKRGKPAPDPFLTAARRLQVKPKDCLVIEDSPPGITGARAAKMKCAGYRNPNSGNQNLAGADLIVKDFADKSREKILELMFSPA